MQKQEQPQTDKTPRPDSLRKGDIVRAPGLSPDQWKVVSQIVSREQGRHVSYVTCVNELGKTRQFLDTQLSRLVGASQ